MNTYTVAITGHRPSKLGWGYNYNHPKWIALKDWFKDYFVRHNVTDVWTGMALGVDTVAALAVLELKDEGYNIRLHCAIPCIGHSSAWKDEATVNLYNSILRRADEVVIVTKAPYKSWMMQVRNKYMVNRCDEVLAVWDGTEGGTGNCIEYAREVCRPIVVLRPECIGGRL